MSEQLPYKDEQWNDLPVPDGETSWQKMEVLLAKDKKRRRILPFWFWRYAGAGLLLTSLAVGGWLWLSSDDNEVHSNNTALEKSEREKDSEVITLNPGKKLTPSPIISSPEEIVSTTSHQKKKDEIIQLPTTSLKLTTPVNKTSIKTKQNKKSTKKLSALKKQPAAVKPFEDVIVQEQKVQTPVITADKKSEKYDSLKINTTTKKDSVNRSDTIKTLTVQPVVISDDEKKKKKSSFVWSAGVGLQQSIALYHQQSSMVDTIGQGQLFFDYFPSLYFKVQRDRWFAQAEFHYSVPQPVKQFSFSQKTRYDATNLILNTERFIIQKMYYHQLPFSVNYFALPNLSIGVGGVYNILAGAVTQQELTSKNVQTGNETVSRNLAPVKGYKDSFLYKTTAGILLQTDYHWKRLSLGLRYTQNFQPFIKYTKPDGTILDEKTQALQAILRFRLWNSK